MHLVLCPGGLPLPLDLGPARRMGVLLDQGITLRPCLVHGAPTYLSLQVCSDRILTCRIKSICSPAKGGTGCYRFNYQPGS